MKVKPEYLEFIRYGAVSAAALLLDFGVLLLCAEILNIHYLVAAAVGFIAGLVFVYLVSIGWVFEFRAVRSGRTEFIIFALIGIAGLGVNEAILWSVTEFAGQSYIVSKLVSAAAVFIFNFGLRKVLLFSKPGAFREAQA